jgi:hypothetical protein
MAPVQGFEQTPSCAVATLRSLTSVLRGCAKPGIARRRPSTRPRPCHRAAGQGNVALHPGRPFTLDGGDGYARLNFAASTDIFREIINRINHDAGDNTNSH